MIEVLEKGTDLKHVLAGGVLNHGYAAWDDCGMNSCLTCGTKTDDKGYTNQSSFHDAHWGWHHT